MKSSRFVVILGFLSLFLIFGSPRVVESATNLDISVENNMLLIGSCSSNLPSLAGYKGYVNDVEVFTTGLFGGFPCAGGAPFISNLSSFLSTYTSYPLTLRFDFYASPEFFPPVLSSFRLDYDGDNYIFFNNGTYISSLIISTSTNSATVHGFILPEHVGAEINFNILNILEEEIFTASPVIATTTGEFFYTWTYPGLSDPLISKKENFTFRTNIVKDGIALRSLKKTVTLASPVAGYPGHMNFVSNASEQILSSYNYLIQTLGTGLSGTLTQIDVQTSNPSFVFYGSRPGVTLFECDDDTYGGTFALSGSNCTQLFSGVSENRSELGTSTQSIFTGSIPLDSSKYYFFRTSGNSIIAVPLYYGSSEDVVDGGCYQLIFSQGIYKPCTNISDLYFYLRGITKATTTPLGNSSVMFFPGLMGSRLYEEKGTLDCGESIIGPQCFSDEELWVSVFDSEHAKLSLDSLGKSTNPIYTKDDTDGANGKSETGVVDEAFSLNLYKSFLIDLEDWKDDEIISDYAFIPYDWRLSLEDIITNGASTTRKKLSYAGVQDFSESYILKKLQELQTNSGNGKVTLIAHSNGGLVVKALVQKLKDTNNPLYHQIDKIIFVAVPQVGTPDAVTAMLHGSSILYGAILDADRSRQLSENMPAVYNLLPSAGYFDMVDQGFASGVPVSFGDNPIFDPQTSEYGNEVTTETELKNYILGTDGRVKPTFSDTLKPNIGNAVLYANAQTVHTVLDTWLPASTTKVIQIAGWGEETIAGLDYKVKKKFLGGEYVSYKPRYVVDGDGTVVVPSALWMSTSTPNIERWWVDIAEYNQNNFPDRVHSDILEIKNLRDFITKTIKNEIFNDLENIVLVDGSQLSSKKLRLHYTLHSPLTLGVTDSQGRYTGLDPITREIREEIPNVMYRQIGEVQFLSVPSSISHTLTLDGYAEGSFSLDIDKQQGNTILESTSFQGIPSSAETIVTLIAPENLSIGDSTLNLDLDGDGEVDTVLHAKLGGTTVYDVTPPELQVKFNTETFKVVLSAIDGVDFNPSILKNATTITLTDESGNITVIPFTEYQDGPNKFRLSFSSIERNSVTAILPETSITYDWKEDDGVLTGLDTKIVVEGVEKYSFNYKKGNNVTIIKDKKGSATVTTTRQGFVVVMVRTDRDRLEVIY